VAANAIRQRLGEAGQAGLTRRHAGANHPRGEDQQAGRGNFLQIMLLQPAQRLAELDRLGGEFVIHLRLVGDDAHLLGGRRVIEAHRHEALARTWLHALEQVLVTGVVGHHQHEARRRLERLAGALDEQLAAVVGQRVQYHGGVLPRLDHFVQIADAAFAYRTGQRAVLPPGALGADQVTTDQVGGGEVVMAGHGVQRQIQPMRHVLHEAGLAAAGRALDQHRHAVLPGLLEQLLLVAQRLVEGRVRRAGGSRDFNRIHRQVPHGSSWLFPSPSYRPHRPLSSHPPAKLDCDQVPHLMPTNRSRFQTFRPIAPATRRHAQGVPKALLIAVKRFANRPLLGCNRTKQVPGNCRTAVTSRNRTRRFRGETV